MFFEKRRWNHEIIAFILERDKIEVENSRNGSKAYPHIRLSLCNLPGNFNVGGREMLVPLYVLCFETGAAQSSIE